MTVSGECLCRYHIAHQYTGRGYATEAVRAFLPVVAEAVGTKEIYGICLKENAASYRVLEKCGFELLYTGTGAYQGQQREIVRSIWKAQGLHVPSGEREEK